MKKTSIYVVLAMLLSGHAFAKVTYDDAVASSSAFYEANNAVNNAPSTTGLGRYEEPTTSGEWELRVFTVVTSGGCCGTEARSYYGKFDKVTGKFLGYINNQIGHNTSQTPNWK